MFPRSHRLSREEVSKVIRNGRVIHTPLFSLRILPQETGSFKTAFVVSKKESRLSVDRNTLKRRARMAMREISTELSPVYVVIFPKKALANTDFKEIVSEMRKSLIK